MTRVSAAYVLQTSVGANGNLYSDFKKPMNLENCQFTSFTVSSFNGENMTVYNSL